VNSLEGQRRDPLTHDELRRVLALPEYPRSSNFDPELVIDNSMGPNVLWLAEALTNAMDLKSGMRVLDLGCGKAISSIFLAREFNLEVWAADLWIGAAANWRRIEDAGEAARVFPVHAEAHDLPFADRFFDAIICVDAYHYFGTDDLYLEYLTRFARDGAEIGIVLPGTTRELDGPPSYLQQYWHRDFATFHSAAWWRHHWEKSGVVEVRSCDEVPDGAQHWQLWSDTCIQQGVARGPEQAEMIRVDAGRTLAFVRMVGARLKEPTQTWSVPSGAPSGVD
jgi:cyclopropane fatty-acyl-phospholipid synthase-like methyltransferase